jgi:hypothetical protein
MPSPMSWQLWFLGCCPVAAEPSEHWIVIWLVEYSLNDWLLSSTKHVMS